MKIAQFSKPISKLSIEKDLICFHKAIFLNKSQHCSEKKQSTHIFKNHFFGLLGPQNVKIHQFSFTMTIFSISGM